MDSSLVTTAIVSIVIALMTSSIWAVIAQRKKTAAEASNQTAQAAETIQKAASGLVMTYKDRIDELEKIAEELTARIDKLEDDLKDARVEINRLEGVNRELNRRLARME